MSIYKLLVKHKVPAPGSVLHEMDPYLTAFYDEGFRVAREAVLKLHHPGAEFWEVQDPSQKQDFDRPADEVAMDLCASCVETWPCSTAMALRVTA